MFTTCHKISLPLALALETMLNSLNVHCAVGVHVYVHVLFALYGNEFYISVYRKFMCKIYTVDIYLR